MEDLSLTVKRLMLLIVGAFRHPRDVMVTTKNIVLLLDCQSPLMFLQQNQVIYPLRSLHTNSLD